MLSELRVLADGEIVVYMCVCSCFGDCVSVGFESSEADAFLSRRGASFCSRFNRFTIFQKIITAGNLNPNLTLVSVTCTMILL